LAEDILEDQKMDVSQLVILPSDGGRFEVAVDGVLVFSKLAENRFPEHDEIKAHL
jgi:selenoprotein W-related protein